MAMKKLLKKAFNAGKRDGADFEEYIEEVLPTIPDVVHTKGIDYEIELIDGIATSKFTRSNGI